MKHSPIPLTTQTAAPPPHSGATNTAAATGIAHQRSHPPSVSIPLPLVTTMNSAVTSGAHPRGRETEYHDGPAEDQHHHPQERQDDDDRIASGRLPPPPHDHQSTKGTSSPHPPPPPHSAGLPPGYPPPPPSYYYPFPPPPPSGYIYYPVPVPYPPSVGGVYPTTAPYSYYSQPPMATDSSAPSSYEPRPLPPSALRRDPIYPSRSTRHRREEGEDGDGIMRDSGAG